MNTETKISSSSFETYLNPNNYSFAIANVNMANKALFDDRYFKISALFTRLEVNESGESQVKDKIDISLVNCKKKPPITDRWTIWRSSIKIFSMFWS